MCDVIQNMPNSSSPSPSNHPPTKKASYLKGGIFLVLLGIIVLAYTQYSDALTLDNFAKYEGQLRDYQSRQPIVVYAVAFLVYVSITGLSLPGASVLTLLFGWYFGLWRGIILVSFASTAGATAAFLLSRFLFRDAIENRFGERLASFNKSLEKEGPFFLFTLRLIPAIPFFVINAVMGLTPIRVSTYWWVSQIGMFPATVVYVYAGSRVPDLQTLADKGISAVLTPTQLTQILLAFIVLGLFPLLVRYTLRFFTSRKVQ